MSGSQRRRCANTHPESLIVKGGWFPVPNELIKHPDLNANDFGIYMVIASFTRNGAGHCSERKIALEAARSASFVSKSVKKLVNAGVIEKFRRYDSKKMLIDNGYRVFRLDKEARPTQEHAAAGDDVVKRAPGARTADQHMDKSDKVHEGTKSGPMDGDRSGIVVDKSSLCLAIPAPPESAQGYSSNEGVDDISSDHRTPPQIEMGNPMSLSCGEIQNQILSLSYKDEERLISFRPSPVSIAFCTRERPGLDQDILLRKFKAYYRAKMAVPDDLDGQFRHWALMEKKGFGSDPALGNTNGRAYTPGQKTPHNGKVRNIPMAVTKTQHAPRSSRQGAGRARKNTGWEEKVNQVDYSALL